MTSYGPPPSDSDSDDFDGMSFGHEFEKKEKNVWQPPPRSQEEIVGEELIQLLQNGDRDAFRQVVEKNRNLIDLNRPVIRFGWTPLMLACHAGHLSLVKYLIIDETVDVNRSIDRWTPLMLACAVINEYDDAALNDRILEIATILIDRKVLINVRNRDGETALMLAIKNGYDSVAELLMGHDASLEVCDNDGNTPLFYAVTYRRKHVAEKLLRQGLVLSDNTNRWGDRPIDIAIDKGFDDIASLFPQKVYVPTVPGNYMNYEMIEEYVPTAYPQQQKPAYVPDVFRLLHGMRLEKFDYLFYKSKIDLAEMLQLTDVRLREIGVEFPYQRDRYILGLMNIHSAPFQIGTLHRPTEAGTLVEVFDSISSCLKSLIICKTSLKFAQRTDIFDEPISPTDKSKEYRQNIDKLLLEIDARAKKIYRKVEILDQVTPQPAPMHIDDTAIKSIGQANTFKRIIYMKMISVCAIGLMLAVAYKLRK